MINYNSYSSFFKSKYFFLFIAFVLLFLLLLPNLAYAAPPKAYAPNVTKNYFGWSTPIVAQNLSGANSNISIIIIDKNGNDVYTQTFTNVPPLSSVSVNPDNVSALGTSFQGSAVIVSNQTIFAIINEHSPNCSMAYEGIIPGLSSNKVYLPNITRKYFGWTTPFVVQNVHLLNPVNFSIDFYPKGSSTSALTIYYTNVQPGRSVFINPDNYPALGTFQGSVVVTGDQAIGAIVNEHYGDSQAMSYTGSSYGGQTVNLPNITRNYAGWTTTFTVQNIHTANPTNMTVDFYPQGSSTSVLTLNYTNVQSKQSIFVNPDNYPSLGTFQGSVVVTASALVGLTAIVNEHSSVDSMAYSSMSSTTTTLPNITRNYFNWTTTFVVQNTSTTSTNVAVDFYPQGSSTSVLTQNYNNVLAGAMVGVNPANLPSLGTFQGSVVVSASTKTKVICNEHKDDGQAMSYNGF